MACSKLRSFAGCGSLAALVGSLLVGDALGASWIYKTSNTTIQLGTGPALLDLGEGNGTSFIVEVPSNARLAIFFNAECSTDMADLGDFVDIDLRVDGVTVSPTAGAKALCSGGAGGLLEGRLTASSDGVTDVAPGTRTIEVEVDLFGESPGDQWWIDDLSLIVILDEL